VPLPGLDTFTNGKGYYENEDQLIEQLRKDVAAGEKIAGRKPTSLVLGALGRCGSGAVDLLKRIECGEIKEWDLAETASYQCLLLFSWKNANALLVGQTRTIP